MAEPYSSDPSEWYIGSTNKKGFHANGRLLPIPPIIAERAAMIVENPKFPFRTFNDIWRDAIVREIMWLEKLEPGIWSKQMEFYKLGIELENEAEVRKSVEKFVSELYEEPDRHQGVKMAKDALGMLDVKYHGGLLRYLEKWDQNG